MRVAMTDQSTNRAVSVEVDVIVISIDAVTKMHVDHRADDNVTSTFGQTDCHNFMQLAFETDGAFFNSRRFDHVLMGPA